MSRLTLPHYGGKSHYMRCSEQFGCSGECTDCEELDKIIEKLAEYEDKEERKPQTNADRIRAMSDEELADFIDAPTPCKEHELGDCLSKECKKCISEWLKQPAYDPPKEETKPDCTYYQDGHCIGQKLMPECDAKNCDRRK